MFSSWYFYIGVEDVANAYVRIFDLFYFWQPFLIFKNLNPTSHFKLKTDFQFKIFGGLFGLASRIFKICMLSDPVILLLEFTTQRYLDKCSTK